MIRYQKLSLKDARKKIEEIDRMSDVEFSDLVSQWNAFAISDYDISYSELRQALLTVYKGALCEASGKSINEAKYFIELKIGLVLYGYLNLKNGFTTLLACDDDTWRYLSVIVMPDLTYWRYPDPKQGDIRINQKRFYSHTRRIWLKTLWWYIHLSWQGNSEKTFNILKDKGTDAISQLIERTGRGYRISLYRALMKEYSLIPGQFSKIYQRTMALNTARCRTIVPILTSGGETGYVKKLFSDMFVMK